MWLARLFPFPEKSLLIPHSLIPVPCSLPLKGGQWEREPGMEGQAGTIKPFCVGEDRDR